MTHLGSRRGSLGSGAWRSFPGDFWRICLDVYLDVYGMFGKLMGFVKRIVCSEDFHES